MTLVGNTYLGIGHLLITFIFGFFIYILVEWQVKRVFDIYVVNPYLCHDEVIRKKYEEQMKTEDKLGSAQ